VSGVAVNDLNTVSAPGYGVVGLNGGYGMDLRTMQLSAFVRVNNALSRHYVGSIIVNDGNGRFFEPGPGFNWLAGVSVSLK
jgi:iron complex outermembrane receptor protein